MTELAISERIQTFLTGHHPGRAPKDPDERLAWRKAWLAVQFDHGFSGPSWPTEFGGMGLGFADQITYAEEFGRAHVPGPLATGVGIAGPTLIKYGTPEQRERWLAPMLRGDVIWAQGFSEPDFGSDLPALRTRAVRDGDHYVVDGAKVWSSSAEIADVIYTLVRTGTVESRQHGISYLVIDARAPGVEIRPIRDLTAESHFCEIVFEGVRVPVADRIGEENGGWSIARTSLGHERAASILVQAGNYRRIVSELIELARQRGLTNQPRVRQQLAELETKVRLMQLNGSRHVATIIATGETGPTASVGRLFSSLFEQRLHEIAVDLLGPYGTLGRRDDHAVERGRWVWGMLRTRASTIGAGTAEIQRNTIGEQVLKLPHEPSATR